MHKVAFVFACLACAATVQGRELEAADALARLLLAQEQQAAFQPSGPGARLAAGTPKLARSRTLMKAPTDTAKMEGVELQKGGPPPPPATRLQAPQQNKVAC
mmetsp:Transcript_157301/g.272858  ORF Transcript_157301/g.272858 Transcript_157301/m.272858 type:complete len:102 (-) Transcript_157301:30-335(-)